MNFEVNKKPKYLSRSEFESLTKDELIERAIQLQTHNLQLRNILRKQQGQEGYTSAASKAPKREFDFSKAHMRHLLLKFMYFGWDYQGFASQEDTNSTIEYHLFTALKKTCLIKSRETSNYHRCGRTDKGVSAFCQVISIDLRSKFAEEDQMITENIENEIDYCGILNRVLPSNIKCISWMPVRNKCYSARFDCIQRTYRYFFPGGDLNIEEMKKACSLLVGTHDFRNLCKMDVGNGVTNFIRTILSADIKQCHVQEKENTGYEMYYLEIAAQSFLWHQIRCIMAILFLIGQRLETSPVISQLLDVKGNPCKPQYNLAPSLPLNLFFCEFRDYTIQLSDNEKPKEFPDTTKWIYNEDNLSKLISDLQVSWSSASIQCTMIKETVDCLTDAYNNAFDQRTFKCQSNILQSSQQKQYCQLMSRKRCESLENRVEHYVKKKRIAAKKTSDK